MAALAVIKVLAKMLEIEVDTAGFGKTGEETRQKMNRQPLKLWDNISDYL